MAGAQRNPPATPTGSQSAPIPHRKSAAVFATAEEHHAAPLPASAKGTSAGVLPQGESPARAAKLPPDAPPHSHANSYPSPTPRTTTESPQTRRTPARPMFSTAKSPRESPSETTFRRHSKHRQLFANHPVQAESRQRAFFSSDSRFHAKCFFDTALFYRFH